LEIQPVMKMEVSD